MLVFEIALRGGGVALFLLWAAFLWRDGREAVGAAFACGVASYVVCSSPGFILPVFWSWQWLLLTFSIGNPVLLWLFARRLFEDGFTLSWQMTLLWLVYVCIGLYAAYIAEAASPQVRQIALGLMTLGTIGFALASAWVLWRGYRDDLVVERRRARPVLLGCGLVFVLCIGGVELSIKGTAPPPFLSMLNALVLTVFGAALVLIFAQGAKSALFAALPRTVAHTPIAPSGAEGIMVSRLLALFQLDYLHREPELSVADVAQRLGIPDHQVRALINQTLGHRNFAAFVNGFRLEEAKAALLDAAQSSVQISTIALDAGFGSLGMFNRVFKAHTGLTPSAFRQSPPKESQLQ